MMTSKGEELTDRIMDATRKIYVKGYQNLSEAELTRLTRTLSTIFHNFADS